jgi:hypothetical protein
MVTETITLQIDPDAASIFKAASGEDREKLQVLLGIWLRQLGKDQSSLRATMDEISNKAKARGLTKEALEDILGEQ